MTFDIGRNQSWPCCNAREMPVANGRSVLQCRWMHDEEADRFISSVSSFRCLHVTLHIPTADYTLG